MAEQLSGHTIVHLLTTVHHGGAERVVLELAQRQRDLGADVRVICLQQKGELLPAFDAAHIPVALVPGGGRPGALRMAWRLGRTLRDARPTVVHTHNSAPQIAAGLGQRLRHWRQPGAILVHTEHGRLGDLRPGLLQWRRWTAGEFDALFAVSADARDQLLQHGIRSAHGVAVIRNGIDLSRFALRDDTQANAARIVHVGRLDHIKGQDILLAAMPLVRAAVGAVRLVIVGDGPARSTLEAQAGRLGIAGVVEFAGATSDVRPYLQAAALFALPSRSEGISIALLEAMATGLAVVATDVGGNHEVIQSGRVGLLVAPESPDELAAGMITLLRAPAMAREMGIAARQEIAARFSSRHTALAYAEQYASARGAAPGRRAA